MRLSLWNISLISLLVNASALGIAQAATSCPEYFSSIEPRTTLFDFRDPRTALAKKPTGKQDDGIVLGSGTTAKAYLVRKPGSQDRFETKKIYKRNAVHSNPENQARFDAKMLNTLRSLSEQKGEENFLFVKAKFGQETTGKKTTYFIKTDYVPGRTVHDLLLSPDVTDATKEKVLKIFSQKLRNLKTTLDSSAEFSALPKEKTIIRKNPGPMYFSDEMEDGASAIFAKTRFREGRSGFEVRSIIIKSDNVIVDPFDLNKMTVIDPY